ncbi:MULTISPECIES: transketolase [Rhodopseudomonas]|uniref:Transketolase n=1 Tax=Rhodopseudomonas palustris TaxID=1076 RepID=A0A0D7EX34_RHOPL|nr:MULTISPECIES: transketolase [Rhodopseudomonas]KIZ44007.1 transketolase [Rhodopseudomonas palustris]WOK17182.1 transketolase [Rhodopseudomonas sp. BAL398]
MTQVDHSRMANAIRALAMDAVEKAKSGHPGLPMGAADIATVLFTQFLKFDAADPTWPDRDRFILSAGHGSMLLYALLYLTGNGDMTLDQIKNFRQLNSKTPGHPENFMTTGVETTTGPLGQGVASSVGTALAERMLAAEFGDVVDHYTYVLCSDGDLMEGVSHEAIALAGHLKLSKLIFLYDDNGISIDGPLTLADNVDQVARFKAHGWNAVQIDGHDQKAIAAAITAAQSSDRPSMIACKTTIGFGAPHKAGTSKAHGEPLGAEELAGAKKALGWDYGPFEIPDDVLAAWRNVGKQGASAHVDWQERFNAMPDDARGEFQRRVIDRTRPEGLGAAIRKLKDNLVAEPQTIATRKASELALEALVGVVPEMVLGSADLTPSNNTRTKQAKDVTPEDFSGRYIHYGIREMGMAAAMNGISTHGGFIPAGGTFMCFTDYARPSMRIAALSHVSVVYIMTHDSIGLGEDGPTHQPVEHLASLRAMPNMRVFRPADPVETAECWQLALENTSGPTVLALSRQNLTPVRTTKHDDNLCAHGAYELVAAHGKASVSLFASGSEVEIAVAAQKLLAGRGVAARVVSVPSLDLLLQQPDHLRHAIIGDAPVKVAIEAAVRFGWDAVIGPDGVFIGMTRFGASAPAKELYKYFGITAEAAAEAAAARLDGK